MNFKKPAADTVIVINRAGMGEAEMALRQKLLGIYLGLLQDMVPLPAALCFYADGVKMAAEGSPVIGELRGLEEKGVHIILCRTCLKYFDLTRSVAVGIQGGMPDILEAQWKADKVITL